VNPILVLVSASIVEHSRRRLIAFFGIGSVLLTAALIYLAKDRSGEVFFGSSENAAFVASLGFLHLFALLATLAVSMGNVGRPFSTGEALTVLARPVTRWQYALARFLASTAVVVGICVLLAVETQVVQVVAAGTFSGSLWGHWGTEIFNLTLLAALATVLSTVIAAPILVAVLAYVVNQVASGIGVLRRLTEVGVIGGSLGRIIDVGWYVTPKLLTSPLTIQGTGPRDSIGQPVNLMIENSAGLVLWGALYLVGLVLLSLWLTNRKEI
jgi:ABC-type transport system involved in multi-copper enzyme maturation permease subunit